jgi:hypothetical protein
MLTDDSNTRTANITVLMFSWFIYFLIKMEITKKQKLLLTFTSCYYSKKVMIVKQICFEFDTNGYQNYN